MATGGHITMLLADCITWSFFYYDKCYESIHQKMQLTSGTSQHLATSGRIISVTDRLAGPTTP